VNEKQQKVFEKMQKLTIKHNIACAAFWRKYAELGKDPAKKKRFLDLAESYENDNLTVSLKDA
jgi:hypothetical protein